MAGNLDIDLPSSGFGQKQFKGLSGEIGSAITYTPLAPAEPLGLVGFDVGIALTAVDIDETSSFWILAAGNESPPGILILPKILIQKGLPFGFDVGLAYTQAHSSNIASIGTELKWAYVRGGAVIPAIAFRGSYSKLLAVDDLDLESYGADVSISKGFAFITPYVGIGQVWIKSQDNSGLNLDEETLSFSKVFMGAKLSIFLISFAGEIEFGETARYSIRANLSL